MALRIVDIVIYDIVAHVIREQPIEACGYLAGSDGVILSHEPMHNMDNSPEHYSFDPTEQFFAVRKMRDRWQKPYAVYHSHVLTPARPSAEDIRLAYDPSLSWVIISLMTETPVIKSFRIDKGIVKEEEIIIETKL